MNMSAHIVLAVSLVWSSIAFAFEDMQISQSILYFLVDEKVVANYALASYRVENMLQSGAEDNRRLKELDFSDVWVASVVDGKKKWIAITVIPYKNKKGGFMAGTQFCSPTVKAEIVPMFSYFTGLDVKEQLADMVKEAEAGHEFFEYDLCGMGKYLG